LNRLSVRFAVEAEEIPPMKKYGMILMILAFLALCCINDQAQQAKPSPAIRAQQAPAGNTSSATRQAQPELKRTEVPEARPVATAPQAALATALPIGTAIRMKLERALFTESSKEGDVFTGRVLEDVRLGSQVVFPVGASLQGHVIRVSEPRRIKGKPMIQIRPEYVVLPNGQRYAITAALVDTNKVNGTSVDDEGRIKGPGHTRTDTVELGAGAGGGAVIGALAGGTKGSFIGAGIGAGAAITHWLTKRNSAYLPAGSEIIFELSRPMTVAGVASLEGN